MNAVRAGVCMVVAGLVSLSVSACSAGADEVPLECCMLKQLAAHCTTPSSTPALQKAVMQWQSVGQSGNKDACKQMIDSMDNSCAGDFANYDESDAIVDCS